jgi:uncharacterized protein (TIGR03437 family)
MRHPKRNRMGLGATLAALLATASVLAPPNRAQVPAGGAVRIRTAPEPVPYTVDGQGMLGPASFNWPAGTKHTLYAAPVDESVTRRGIRYTFAGWKIGSQVLREGNPVTITSDPAIGEIVGEYAVEYGLQVTVVTCDGSPCAAPGKVYANGAMLTETTTVWTSPGGLVQLQAVPNPGFVFAGWTSTNRGQVVQGFLNNVTVSEPMAITPMFQPARPIQFETLPEKLQIIADRAPVYTPVTLDWGWGSTHSLAVPSPQQSLADGLWYVFSGWEHGGPATQSYKVENGIAAATVVARFSPAMKVTLGTAPPGLKLRVDGREGQPPYNPVWGLGESHQVEAPLQQTDAQGRVWAFDGWSDGQPAARSFTVPAADPALGARIVASYKQLGRVTVSSNLSGVTAVVDGVECRLPCTVDRPLGASVRVSAPAVIPLGDASRAQFDRWSDGSTGVANLTAAAEPVALAASYRTLHRLVVASEPADGAACQTAPESPDGFYDSSQVVTVAMAARGGFRFRRWEGDIAAGGPQGSVLMSQPRTARAVFERVPFVPPSGVRNAAADSAGEGVAPGSIVAVVGSHLAAAEAAGPDSPLAQSLAGVTVRAGDMLLPLLFVSPERITAQLPPDLSEGPAVMAARSGNQEEIRAEFRVVRNAPGLFATQSEDRTWAVAAHADGSPVTPAAPARAGERITLFGTGFGPTQPQRPWGFAVPADPPYKLADPVTLQVAGAAVAASSAVAAAGRVGIDAVAFVVPAGLSGEVPVAAAAGGQSSNTVILRVE